MHLNEPRPTGYFLDRFRTTPAVATIHSQWPCEQPVPSPRISRYICIREEIRQKITLQDGIPVERTTVIPNGVDFERFKPKMTPPGKRRRVLFVGTLDVLRRPTIADLAARARHGEIEFWLCGENLHPPQNPKVVFKPNYYFEPRWEIEELFQACDETAGILMGRTTIEGWACGKPGWIYDVDLQGWVQGRTLHPPPADMTQFDIKTTAARILEIYKEAGK
jgi:glycosyltransferase involved in cell wall biosynthesis